MMLYFGSYKLELLDHIIFKPEDQWSCKRSPDYFPGINTTVKQEKILMSIKGCYSVANLQKNDALQSQP